MPQCQSCKFKIQSTIQQMNQPKSDNQKIIKYISNKIKDGQMILMLENVILFNKATVQQAKLVITSTSLYFVHNFTIKKYFKATSIETVILTPFCSELVIYYDPKGDQSSKEAVRLQSIANVKIIQHIIIVREKFNQMQQKLAITLSSTKNLQSIANLNESSSKSRLLKFLFHKKEGSLDLQQRINGQCQIIRVSLKDFAIEIGQKMYNQIYKNIKLLYINSSETFRFEEEKFDVEEIDSNKKIFKPQKGRSENPINLRAEINKCVLLRKIGKVSEESDRKLTEHLKTYKNEQYKQELLYALETETHYQIYTTLQVNEKSCLQFLLEHEFLSEKDLRSIFFKLIQMIENSHEIFYSLSPENIIMGQDGIRISEIFSCLKKRTQIDYLAPQQLMEEKFTEDQVELINLWKAGILMFELAYGNVPFPEEFIASKIFNSNTQIQLNFPSYSLRTQQFQSFIKSILKINPRERGIQDYITSSQKFKPNAGQGWKQNIMKLTWLKYR